MKNIIDNIINLNVDPHLDPPPILHPIHISEGLYILGVQIFSKEKGIYGIRRINITLNLTFTPKYF